MLLQEIPKPSTLRDQKPRVSLRPEPVRNANAVPAPTHAGVPLAPRDESRLPAALDTMSQRELENHLAQVRLGIASSLFTALRMKHADTASHSLRVSLNTASWMLALGMSDDQRDVM